VISVNIPFAFYLDAIELAVAGVPTKVAVGRLVLCNSFEENTLFATTPRVNETARGLAVDLVLSNGSRFNTGFTFEYRDNAVFTAIRPRNHLTVYAFIRLYIYLHISPLTRQ